MVSWVRSLRWPVTIAPPPKKKKNSRPSIGVVWLRAWYADLHLTYIAPTLSIGSQHHECKCRANINCMSVTLHKMEDDVIAWTASAEFCIRRSHHTEHWQTSHNTKVTSSSWQVLAHKSRTKRSRNTKIASKCCPPHRQYRAPVSRSKVKVTKSTNAEIGSASYIPTERPTNFKLGI